MKDEPGGKGWASRERRKRHSLLDTGRGTTWWAPGAIGWWIGVLFAIGSVFFGVGAAPGYLFAVGNGAAALTFFLGSLFFTTAAVLQYLETVNTRRAPPGAGVPERVRFLSLEPRRIDWWSSLVQLAGTLYFNVSTFEAMRTNLPAHRVDHLVWKPDAIGSAFFIIAGTLAWLELRRSARSWQPRNLSWCIVALNLLGSFAFGASAFASFVVPTTGHRVNAALVNLGTFFGALCFLVGAILLLPERTRYEDGRRKR